MARFGASAALLTPFTETGAIDGARLSRHARDLIARGLDGVTLFGTTGEGASIGKAERASGIEALHGAAISPERVTLGLWANAVPDVVSQIHEGLEAEITRFLLAPPGCFPGARDAELFDWHAQVLSASPATARVVLYSIPQVTGVAVSPELAGRLASAFPGRVHAIKDSSGDWANALRLLQSGDLPVLIGDERLLHKAVPHGCSGSITGMANLFPERLCQVLVTGSEDAALCADVDRLVAGPVIPGLKMLLANLTAQAGWERVRPPLGALAPEARALLLSAEAFAHG